MAALFRRGSRDDSPCAFNFSSSATLLTVIIRDLGVFLAIDSRFFAVLLPKI